MVIAILSTTCLTSCIKTVIRPVIMADENLIFKCPVDTVGGKIYYCDSTVYALKKSALLDLYEERADCEAEVTRLKKTP